MVSLAPVRALRVSETQTVTVLRNFLQNASFSVDGKAGALVRNGADARGKNYKG